VDRPYVEWVRVENFRCIKSADLHLTPLHALIGPNDSGKSSFLRAIAGQDSTMWVPGAGALVRSNYSAQDYPEGRQGQLDAKRQAVLHSATQPRTVLRLDPDAMRARVRLIPHGHEMWFGDEKGTGLAALYDALLSRNVAAFAQINQRFNALFPTARSIRLHNASREEKQLGLTLVDGNEVGPDEMSEGMLYWLAFAIIEHVAPRAMLLIEEPENGLHPARIKEVMRVLRDVSQRTQIILATHSPLVINELQPEEVTIVTRTPERGTICTPMTETKHFQTRKEIYALGELWLSFADGDLESELVPDSPPTPVASAG
jgi:predicted ATPase